MFRISLVLPIYMITVLLPVVFLWSYDEFPVDRCDIFGHPELLLLHSRSEEILNVISEFDQY